MKLDACVGSGRRQMRATYRNVMKIVLWR